MILNKKILGLLSCSVFLFGCGSNRTKIYISYEDAIEFAKTTYNLEKKKSIKFNNGTFTWDRSETVDAKSMDALRDILWNMKARDLGEITVFSKCGSMAIEPTIIYYFFANSTTLADFQDTEEYKYTWSKTNNKLTVSSLNCVPKMFGDATIPAQTFSLGFTDKGYLENITCTFDYTGVYKENNVTIKAFFSISLSDFSDLR